MTHAAPLLELQRVDRTGDRLRHERETLPARAALAERKAALVRLAAERETATAARLAARREEQRIEGEVATLRAQAKEVETQLYSGKVRVPSELSGLQAKLASLRGQQGTLEDAELAVLEQAEGLEAELSRLDRERAEIEQACAGIEQELAAEEARIDALLEGVARERTERLPAVPERWRAAYERLRGAARLGGVAAAALEKDACGACRTTVPMMLQARIRAAAPDDVVHCERCQRLLVAAG